MQIRPSRYNTPRQRSFTARPDHPQMDADERRWRTVGCFYLRTSASSADSSLGMNTSRLLGLILPAHGAQDSIDFILIFLGRYPRM